MSAIVLSPSAAAQRIPRLSRFAWMMALYSENHQRLHRLFEPETLAAGLHRSTGADGMVLRVEVVEHHAYTVELRLAYEQVSDDVTGDMDPSAWVRYYRDARQAEVTHCHFSRRWQDALGLHPPLATLVGHRARMSVFLSKWLEYLGEYGHSRSRLRFEQASKTSA